MPPGIGYPTRQTFQDPRSTQGIVSRGSNIYKGATNNATRASAGSVRQPTGSNISKGGSISGSLRPTPTPITRPTPPPSRGPIGGPLPVQRPTGIPNPNTVGGPVGGPPSTGSGGGLPNPSAIGGPNGPAPLRGPGAALTPIEAAQIALGGPLPVQRPTGLPAPPTTDPILEAARATIEEMIALLNNNQQAESQRLQSQLDTYLQRLGIQREDALESNANRLATQGLFRSGIATQSQGNLTEEFNRTAEQVNSDFATQLHQLSQSIATQIAQLQGSLRSEEAQFAIRAEQAAKEAAEQAAQASQAAIDQLSEQIAAQNANIENLINNISAQSGVQPTPTPSGQFIPPAFQPPGGIPNQSLVGPSTAAQQDVSTVIRPPLGEFSRPNRPNYIPDTQHVWHGISNMPGYNIRSPLFNAIGRKLRAS